MFFFSLLETAQSAFGFLSELWGHKVEDEGIDAVVKGADCQADHAENVDILTISKKPPVTIDQEQEEITGQQTHIEDDRHPDSKTLELTFSQQGALYGAVAVQHVMMTGSRKQMTNCVLKYGRKKLVCLLSGSASWQVVMLRSCSG
ncbi:hypothetical protein ILYODFUR_038237 [Ilyodon furcidens]|uniref:Uncharacterized protein n=1 Tax=Ilyodon furcidens TaxID=33524 RepID=A0ABV0T7C8_9TELE